MMNSRLQDIIHHKSKNIDKLIRRSYSASYLNNTKWYKLMDGLTQKFDQVFINYKLVYDEVIEGSIFNMADCEPYFIEPIKYKEVEWIEIPNSYEYWINTNNFKAGKQIYTQDFRSIKNEIKKLGKFRIDEFEDRIRLYAYI